MTQTEVIKQLARLSLSVNNHQAEQFCRFTELLLAWNQKMNLTAITQEADIMTRHYLDSLMELNSIPQGARVIDVGTGAGFPGIPIKIMRPDIQLTLLDSLGKRVTFLQEAIGQLGLSNVTAVHARAEEYLCTPGEREGYDVAVSRAVANLRVLCELCLPYVRVGGIFRAYKGPAASDELSEAQHAITTLGGAVDCVTDGILPGESLHHPIIMIKKVRQTPPDYPRMYAKMTKKPL